MNLTEPPENTSTVWPPAPVGTGIIAPLRPPFIAQDRIQRTIMRVMIIYIATEIVTQVLRFVPGSAAEMVDGIVGLLYSVFSLILITVFLIWVFNVYRNLYALQAKGLSVTPGWAVGFYFVPIMSLYKPYRIMREIWIKSGNETGSKSVATVSLWWGWYIVLQIVSLMEYGINYGAASRVDSESMTVTLLALAVELVALLMMYRVVSGVNERQNAKEAELLKLEEESRVPDGTLA